MSHQTLQAVIAEMREFEDVSRIRKWADTLAALAGAGEQEKKDLDKVNACINCGESQDGGYLSGWEGHINEGAVGPFCSQCWEFLRETFQPEHITHLEAEVARLTKERDRETELRRKAEKHNTELRAALTEAPYPSDLWEAEQRAETAEARVQELERERDEGSFDVKTLKYYGHVAMSNAQVRLLVQRADAAESRATELEREVARLRGTGE